MLTSNNKTSDVGNVCKEYRANSVSYLSKFLKFNLSCVCASATNDHFWFYYLCDIHNSIVVYATIKLYAIKEALIHLARAAYLCAVS